MLTGMFLWVGLAQIALYMHRILYRCLVRIFVVGFDEHVSVGRFHERGICIPLGLCGIIDPSLLVLLDCMSYRIT